MEAAALYFLKLWRPTTTHINKDHLPRHSSGGNSDTTTEIATTVGDTTTTDDDCEFDEEDDSFFELELTAVPDLDNNNNKDSIKFPPPTVSLSPSCNNNSYNGHIKNFHLPSKRKILPVELNSNKQPQPQSPISLLKSSAPRFRVLMFKKSKSMAAHEAEFLDSSPKTSRKKQESKLFTVKFKLKEAANVPVFTRDCSLRKQISDDSLSEDSSKRFSKEVIQKYLKLIKPLYVKVSKKPAEKPRFSTELSSVASPASSPATVTSFSPKNEKQRSFPAGISAVCKNLGKSKSSSASATVAPPSTVSRRDDSLLLHNDGIQSAILHCKKSFNSSSTKDCSLLSRFASDSLISPRVSHEDNGIRI
ncbi:membrane-associated kinase regulator 5 [Mercurialis annua]|uniref:membrane-associated kinase regulator 5 n=1 Tax=Mercurialis annua TaxID=3986 RepID=UPI002160617E|nr:membrane-associated kinase regulator 5 [Mercurialis annua]